MTTTRYSLIEDAIQDLLQGHTNSTNDEADQEGPVSEYQRLRVKANALESQLRILRDAKRATDMACDLEPLTRSQNAIESPREKDPRERRKKEKLLQKYWKDDSFEPAGEPAPRTLEWTERTIESVIETLTQEQADETYKCTDLKFNLPWNSPVVTGPLIVRDKLQDRLSPLEKQLADLLWQQNTLIPIARVLPEILIDIFELVLANACGSFQDDTNLLLMVLTRICRDWTRLVFNTPCLWSRILPARSLLKHVAVALARSQPVPLNVQFNSYGIPHIELHRFLGAIKKHADRMKVLHLWLSPPELVDAVNSSFAKVFLPRLETLRISTGNDGSGAVWPDISFLKGPWYDTLQHLCLYSVMLPTGSYGELRGLRTLSLTVRPNQGVLTTAEILRALPNSPNLESLSLNLSTEMGEELSAGTANLVTPVRLDRLHEITLRLPPVLLSAVLRSILTIKLIKVRIETTMPQENKLAWTEVLLTNEIQPFVQVIESVLQSTSGFSIRFDGQSLGVVSKYPYPYRYNTPYVNLQFTGDRLPEVGRWMAKSLDLGSAEVELYIEDRTASWMETVPLILSTFHNTVRLQLTGAESVSERAIELLSTPLYIDSGGSQHFPFPRLSYLQAQVHEPSGIISILERRYIRHGSTDVASTGYPVALSSIVLETFVGSSAPYTASVLRLASVLPGCGVWVMLIRSLA